MPKIQILSDRNEYENQNLCNGDTIYIFPDMQFIILSYPHTWVSWVMNMLRHYNSSNLTPQFSLSEDWREEIRIETNDSPKEVKDLLLEKTLVTA